MLDELTRRQNELHGLSDTFQGLRSFDLELRKATKGKPFRIGNSIAWDAVRSLYRTIVIDLAGWVRSFHAKWLRQNIQGQSLTDLRASRTRAGRFVKDSQRANQIPAELRRSILGHQEQQLLAGQRTALGRLFGADAIQRGCAEERDIRRLEKRLERWAHGLDGLRNLLAHPFGSFDEKRVRRKGHSGPKRLILGQLARRFRYCGRLLNDLRMLAAASHYIMPPLEARKDDAMARDLLDLIVMGSIQNAVNEWSPHASETAPFLWQQRDAHYAQLHAYRRLTKSEPFNEYRPAPK